MPFRENIEAGEIYYKGPNGEVTKWTGFSAVEITDDNNLSDNNLPYAFFNAPDSLSATMTLTHKNARKVKILLRQIQNKIERIRRNRKRAKEQARRAILKWNALHPDNPITAHKEHVF